MMMFYGVTGYNGEGFLLYELTQSQDYHYHKDPYLLLSVINIVCFTGSWYSYIAKPLWSGLANGK